MVTSQLHGNRRPGRSEECKAPMKNWRDDVLNIADQCAKSLNFRRKFDGLKYKAIAFWEVIVFGVLFSLGTADACSRLNKIKIAEEINKSRVKRGMRELGGKYTRHERLVPDKSQVNDFKRKLPRWFVKNLEQFVFKAQVDYLLGCKMLPRHVDVIIDYNDKPYYGKLKTEESETLFGTIKAPGTRKVRKFLGVLIKAGQLRVFTHFHLIHKGVHHDEFVKDALSDLMEWGFTIRRVLADRWFANRGVLEWCQARDIEYIGPLQKRKNVINYIERYLRAGKQIVFTFFMQGDPARFKGKYPLQSWIFLATRDKERLSSIRRAFLQQKLTLREATEKIHVFIVTQPPPATRHARAAWLRSVARYYKHRWYIETAFRDLDRIQPTCHARTDIAKIFNIMMRCWLYNEWQIDRERKRRLRRVPASTRHGPTLTEFCDTVFETGFRMVYIATTTK
jgi:hypothetical protein